MIIGVGECRLGDRPKKVANQIVQLGVDDQVRRLLVEQRSPQHARKPKQSMAAARQAIRLAVRTDQLTLNAEGGRLQRDKTNIPKSIAIDGLAKHDRIVLAVLAVQTKVNTERSSEKVTVQVPVVEKLGVQNVAAEDR